MLAILLSLSLTGGTLAHAMEPVTCVDTQVASQLGHFEGDRDEVLGDEDKGTAHHHGGCHGHHVAEPARDGMSGLLTMPRSMPRFKYTAGGASTLTDPADRPPRA